MPTNDRKVNIYHKRLLSLTAIKDEFLDYLQGAIDDVATGFFAGASGTLDQDRIGLVVGSSNNKFSIDTSLAQRVLAGQHTIDLTKITGAGITTNIIFEATPAALYYVGVFFAEVEVGMEVNPRSGDPEYSSLKQTFGNVDFPSSVVDHATYIRVFLDTITETLHSHAGRSVKVWLVDPVTPDESIAFYTGLVAFDGTHNYVDIPYSGSLGPLGQDTSVEPPSTVTTDYRVFIEGVSWRGGVDLSSVPGCAFLGTIVGGAPPTFNTANQPILQIISLDRAYDGIPGPGAGRFIWVDTGAVSLVTTASGTGDDHNAQLRLYRLGCTDFFQLCYETLTYDPSAIPLAFLELFACPYVDPVETCNVSGDTITFTRPGVDLKNIGTNLSKYTHLVWVAGGNAAGLYTIDALPTTATCTVRGLQTGATPGWAPESGVPVCFLQPRMVMSNSAPDAAGVLANWRGFMTTGRDGAGNAGAMFNFVPSGSGGFLGTVKNNYWNPVTGMGEPCNMVMLDIDVAPGLGGKLWLGLDYGSGKQVACGLDIRPHVYGSGAADRYAFNVRPQADYSGVRGPSTRQAGFHNDLGAEIQRWEPRGRMADVHRFIERWDYNPSGFLPASERWQYNAIGNGATLYFNDPAVYGTGLKGQGDIVHIRTAGSAVGDGCSVNGPPMFIIRATGPIYRRLHFYGRARALGGVDTSIWMALGIAHPASTSVIAFEVNNVGVANPWTIVSRISAYQNYANAQAIDLTGLWSNDLGWKEFYFTVDVSTNSIQFWMTGQGSPSAINIRHTGLQASDWLDKRVCPYIAVGQSNGTNARQFEVDHIEVWDENIQAGPKE